MRLKHCVWTCDCCAKEGVSKQQADIPEGWLNPRSLEVHGTGCAPELLKRPDGALVCSSGCAIQFVTDVLKKALA